MISLNTSVQDYFRPSIQICTIIRIMRKKHHIWLKPVTGSCGVVKLSRVLDLKPYWVEFKTRRLDLALSRGWSKGLTSNLYREAILTQHLLNEITPGLSGNSR